MVGHRERDKKMKKCPEEPRKLMDGSGKGLGNKPKRPVRKGLKRIFRKSE